MTVTAKKKGSHCFPLRKMKGSYVCGFLPLSCWVFPSLQAGVELLYRPDEQRGAVVFKLDYLIDTYARNFFMSHDGTTKNNLSL